MKLSDIFAGIYGCHAPSSPGRGGAGQPGADPVNDGLRRPLRRTLGSRHVPVGRRRAVRLRCRTSHFERPAMPKKAARSIGRHVVGRPRKNKMRWARSLRRRAQVQQPRRRHFRYCEARLGAAGNYAWAGDAGSPFALSLACRHGLTNWLVYSSSTGVFFWMIPLAK